MGNLKEQPRLFNVLPEEEFLARHAEVQQLFHAGLDVTRSLQTTSFLSGPRKSGKTEILKRVYNRLFWEQERVIPFFHALPKILTSAEAFCREYYLRNVLEYVGFLKKDAQIVLAEDYDLKRIVRLAYESKIPWLINSVDQFHVFCENRDHQAMARLSILFPATAALHSGLVAFVLVDDFHHIVSLEAADLVLLTRDFLLAFESRQAPHCLAGTAGPMFQTLFKTAELPGTVEVLPLSPLELYEAENLLLGLCQRFEIKCEPAMSRFIVQQLNRNPFYVRCLIQAARRRSVDFRTPRSFADLYGFEITQGNLHLYFNGLVHSTPLTAEERIKALELLHFSTRTAVEFSAVHYLRSRPTTETLDLEKILSALSAVGLIDYGMGVVASMQDPVLQDWIVWNFGHKVSGVRLSQAAFELTSGWLKRFERTEQAREVTGTLKQMADLLAKMKCQSVPSVLLNYGRFIQFEALQEPAKTAFSNQQGDITLPEIINVTLRKAPPSQEEPDWEFVIGRGFERGSYSDETEVSWIAGCVAATTLGLDEIQHFYEQTNSIRREENLKRVTLWLVAEGKFNQAAMNFAESNQMLTSNRQQLEKIVQLLSGVKEDVLELEEPEEKMFSYELTIPIAALDAELVAVKALEQVVDSSDFDEKSKGQVRMALLEALISMKEAAASESGKIELVFRTAAHRLVVRLYMAAPRSTGDSVAALGLKMLQSLMDDVRLNRLQRGFELVMTKYRRNVKREAV